MAVPFQQPAFTLGEVSPALFGRQDLARSKVGAATARNMFARYSGGLYSRPGTAFVGYSKQTGTASPPRLIPFQFNINQGLVLEFGHFYMRIIQNGAYVTEGALPVSGITRGRPAEITLVTQGAASATANVGAVVSSYAPGDQVTLAGGVVGSPTVLGITNTQLASATVLTTGSGYETGDTITLAGGVFSVAAQIVVTSTQVTQVTIAAAGAGGTDGQQVVTGTTGTGTPFTALVQVTGGAITAILALLSHGSYTVNPPAPANEPVTGAGLAGAQLALTIGALTTSTVAAGGTFTGNPAGGGMTQSATTGVGTGITVFGVFGPKTLTIVSAGSYTTVPTNPAAQLATTGTGAGAFFNITWANVQAYNVGDWLYFSGFTGITQVNGATAVVSVASPTVYQLVDVYGNPFDTSTMSPYAGGGTVARIYTATSPYAQADLEWLKWTQSADVMSLCCVNQQTLAQYQPYDLRRLSNTHWTFSTLAIGASILPPNPISVAASAAGAANYRFFVTSVAADGSESLGQNGDIFNAVNIYATAGTLTVSWPVVQGATSYNVYQAATSFSGAVPDGTPCGIVATGILGTSWQNTNTTPDYTRVPPEHQNPFAGANQNPGVVQYFQERRVYANTVALPDNYFMSQPGAFSNFDKRIPPVDDDAIIGAPWVTQVDGVQFMVDMPGGLVVLTGREAWQLTGGGGSSLNPQPVTPATQQAQPQAFNGCHNHIPPIRIDYDILYVQAKGSIIRDLNYNFYSNIYTGQDITLNSSHLFNYFGIQEWCWAEEPFKLLWVVRTDGSLLSCTFVKPEQIIAWTRHDTQGSYVSTCSVTEPPVDAVYVATQRRIGANPAYMVERMDNRLWTGVDGAWCVDAGRSLAQPTPSATLVITPIATGRVDGPRPVTGGTGYSSLTQIVIADEGGGTGATATPIIVGGVIVGCTLLAAGFNYVRPVLSAVDPAGSEGGSGFTGECDVQNFVTLATSADVFSLASLGSIVRTGGGVARIVNYTGPRAVTAQVQVPFGNVIPVSDLGVSATPPSSYTPVSPGNWTLTAPVTTVQGLLYLAGASVVGVADSQPFGPVTVSSNGTIELPGPSTNVVAGLAFLPQVQSLYLDTGQAPTVQGRRKKIAAATVRVEASGPFQAGSNQVDGSTLSPPQTGPLWSNMATVPAVGIPPYMTDYVPLGTGDVRVFLAGGYQDHGQVALQQPNPLPLNVLSIISEADEGDIPETKAPPQQQRGRMAQQEAS